MGRISPYVSNEVIIASLRKYYSGDEQYSINFHFWLHTSRIVKDGVLINVGSRRFLVDYHTGSVIKYT